MRVFMPTEHQSDPSAHLLEDYPSKIIEAGIAYSLAAYQYSTLTLREFEGARARTAEINGCLLCQKFRAAQDLQGYINAVGGSVEKSILANGPAPNEPFYQHVSDWQQYANYSDRERLAIALAEGMGLNPQGIAVDEPFWAKAKKAFTDKEIIDLTYSISAWMGLGRAGHVLGMDGVCSWVSGDEAK